MTLIVVLVVWLAAVVSSSAQPVALAIAGLVAAGSPLVLRYVRLDGASMSALSYVVALGIALVAEWLVGDLTWSRQGIVAAFLGTSGLWAVQQAVYTALRQWAPNSALWVTSPPKAA